MKIVIPVSKADVEHLDLLTQVIIHQGSLIGHDILLFPTPLVQEAAMDAAQKLRSVCPTVAVQTTYTEYPEGWPQAPNRHWHAAVTYLDRSGNKSPWLWLEVDAVPMVKNWAGLLWDAYVVSGKPFYGFVKPVAFTRPGVEGTYTKPNEDMLMGVAIYPPGISQDALIQPLFHNVGRTFGAAKEPFDLYLRWVFKRRGVCASRLIHDLWRTANYRHDGAAIVCDALAGESRAKGGVVPGEAVLVHGVKDGSLQRLVLGKKEASVLTQKAPEIRVKSSLDPRQAAATIAPLDPKQATHTVALLVDRSDEAMVTFLSKPKAKFKEFQEHFGLSAPDAAILVRDLGFTIKSFGWISKTETEEL